jgi:hypothetical protein
MDLSMAAAVREDMNRWWKVGLVVEATGGWVGELRGTVPELEDHPTGSGSGRRELALARCLMVG